MIEFATIIEKDTEFMDRKRIETFNGVLKTVPTLFKEEIKKTIFGLEFGDIPFNKLQNCLIPKFDDEIGEEIKKKESELESKKQKSNNLHLQIV